MLLVGTRLYVSTGSIEVFDADGDSISAPGGFPLGNGVVPMGIGYDAAHGHIIVGFLHDQYGTAGAPPRTFTRGGALVATSGTWSVPGGLYPSNERGIAVDGTSGKVYVTANGQSTGAAPAAIYVYDAQGTYQATIDPTSFSTFPAGYSATQIVQEDVSHDLVFTDSKDGVWTMDAGGNQLPPTPCQCSTPGSPFSIAGGAYTTGVAQDPATRWLYVASYTYNGVYAYDTAGNAIALTGGQNSFATGLTDTDSIAIAP